MSKCRCRIGGGYRSLELRGEDGVGHMHVGTRALRLGEPPGEQVIRTMPRACAVNSSRRQGGRIWSLVEREFEEAGVSMWVKLCSEVEKDEFEHPPKLICRRQGSHPWP